VADKAIVVGIGSYPKFGADGISPNDLPGAIADADAVADWLAHTAHAQVTKITSVGRNGVPWNVTSVRPVDWDVKEEFRPFVTSDAPKVADRLYVYMAGHGLAPDARSRCLILANAEGIRWVPNIEAPAWIDWFANQTHFDELVLWMDCCGTQALEYSPGRPFELPNTASRTPPPAKVFMAFGSGMGRSSYEGPIGPGGTTRGLFTARLLTGLKGAAADQTGQVRSESLANYLLNGAPIATDGAAPRVNNTQMPVIPQRDDMLFATQVLPTYRIRPRTDGGGLLVDGTQVTITSPPGPFSQTTTVASGWVTFPLGVGLYKLAAPGFTRYVEIGASTPNDIE
jgi:hypothetical protein